MSIARSITKPPARRIDRFSLPLIAFLAGASLAAAPAPSRPQTIVGIISDNMCAEAGHASMRMGPTDAECTNACVDAHGALYVLVSGRDVYTLSDQRAPQMYAGQKVRVTGTVETRDTGRIFRLISIAAAK